MAEIDRILAATRTAGTVARVAQAARAKLEQFARTGQLPPFPDRPLTRGALIDLEADATLEFALNPEALQTSLAANYATSQPVGHSHPVLQYAGTGALSVTFTLELDDTVLRGGNRDEFIDPATHVAFLHSLLYPGRETNNPPAARPPRVLLVYGQAIRLRGFVTAVQATWSRFGHRDLRVGAASAVVTFQEQLDRRMSTADARRLRMARTALRPETVPVPLSATGGPTVRA